MEGRAGLGDTATARCQAARWRGYGLTDAVLGLEDLIVVLCILDLGPRLTLVPVIFAAGAAPLALRVVLYPGGCRAKQKEARILSEAKG